MGMTIDEIIRDFKETIDSITSYGYTTNHSDALNKGIKIMRNYQKITEIMSELNGDFYGSYLKDRQALEKIYEVVEDGNDD